LCNVIKANARQTFYSTGGRCFNTANESHWPSGGHKALNIGGIISAAQVAVLSDVLGVSAFASPSHAYARWQCQTPDKRLS